MRIEFLLGPAGSGKTFRCLDEARAALEQAPEGLPLVFIAPKQATYQLERQLLSNLSNGGYTRLHIFSFDRLARWIFARAGRPEPALLSEEGRIMVLRALLARHEMELSVFRTSSRATGFARQLSQLVIELQQNRISVSRLWELAQTAGNQNRLAEKLSDLALLLEAYRRWLKAEELEDTHELIDLAANAFEQAPQIQFGKIWLDGFARLTGQEQRLLKLLASRCERLTLAFCLDSRQAQSTWHSHWSAVAQSFCELRANLESVKEAEIVITEAEGDQGTKTSSVPEPDLFSWSAAKKQSSATSPPRSKTRFNNPELEHLEKVWSDPRPYPGNKPLTAIRLIECPDPEGEATFAAREILRYVRQGGRFRETAVIVRQLDNYHDVLRRVFLRYQIPFFLDRRELIAHHPLAELVRGALRTLAFNWRQRDWFCALKSGLVPATEEEIDQLENQALARGWEGAVWQNPILIRNEPELTSTVEKLRQRLVAPFVHLSRHLDATPSGEQLAGALVDFWKELRVEGQLENWSGDSVGQAPMHLTVWEQLQQWVQNLALAFRHHTQTLKEWIPIVESGLENLNVGVIPPVLDQVLLGAVDRSRNPDLQRVFVLGLNEGIFPAPFTIPPILSELDRSILERGCSTMLGVNVRSHIAQERFFGYIACTRAREQLAITYATRNLQGAQLNPSSLVAHLQRLFPQLDPPEPYGAAGRWAEVEHHSELIGPLLKARVERHRLHGVVPEPDVVSTLGNLPVLAPILTRLEEASPTTPVLSRKSARNLYGRVHETSVSALEKFGACPFWFFVESGLKAEEREQFRLDARQTGTFQHKVLEQFHLFLKAEKLSWHGITAQFGREQIGRIADELIETFEEGMLKQSHENRFIALQQKEQLERFISLLIGWMPQYRFEPAEVELGFGLERGPLPPWKINAIEGYALALRGSIDRVDLIRPPGSEVTWCVVMDYKLRGKKLDETFMTHGIQLQLPGYLAALRGIASAEEILGVAKLRPVGVFFVNLSGSYKAAANRAEVLGDQSAVHRSAFQHIGRFDIEALDLLDNRNAPLGDQFPYRRLESGGLDSRTKGPMQSDQFLDLLEATEKKMGEFARRIYQGNIAVDPFQKGTARACTWCEHASICRIDPWMHDFRNLKKGQIPVSEEEEEEKNDE